MAARNTIVYEQDAGAARAHLQAVLHQPLAGVGAGLAAAICSAACRTVDAPADSATRMFSA